MLSASEDHQDIIQRIAALDIGKAELVCCVRVPDENHPGKRLQEITTYSTMTRSLLLLADPLRSAGCCRAPGFVDFRVSLFVPSGDALQA